MKIWQKLSFNYHQKSSNAHLISSPGGGLVVEPWTKEQEGWGLIPTSSVLCPRAKTLLLAKKYW